VRVCSREVFPRESDSLLCNSFKPHGQKHAPPKAATVYGRAKSGNKLDGAERIVLPGV
jgi:hypothetical protein